MGYSSVTMGGAILQYSRISLSVLDAHDPLDFGSRLTPCVTTLTTQGSVLVRDMARWTLRAQLLAPYPNLQVGRTDPLIIPEVTIVTMNDWLKNEIVRLISDGAKPRAHDTRPF